MSQLQYRPSLRTAERKKVPMRAVVALGCLPLAWGVAVYAGCAPSGASEMLWLGHRGAAEVSRLLFTIVVPTLGAISALQIFRWREFLPSHALRPLLLACLFLMVGVPIDLAATTIVHARSRAVVQNDWRYSHRAELVQSLRHAPLPHASGTPYEHVGPFRPHAVGSLVRAAFTVDALGYRRELGPWPACPAGQSSDRCHVYTVLCVGGSTTEGQTVERGDLPYPDVLEGLLNGLLPSHQHAHVINAGRSGANVNGALAQVARHFAYAGPVDVVVFYGGINTIPKSIWGRHVPRVSFVASALDQLRVAVRGAWAVRRYDGAMYEQPLREMVHDVQGRGGKVVLITFALPFDSKAPWHELAYWDRLVPWHSSARTLARLVDIHNRITREVAADTGATLIDAAELLHGRPELFADDEHFVQQGRNELASLVAPAVREALSTN